MVQVAGQKERRIGWPALSQDRQTRTINEMYEPTGYSGKIVCFFQNLLQPLPRLHCCKRPSKLSTQCECTVTPIGWEPLPAECWRGRGGKLLRILGKNHNI